MLPDWLDWAISIYAAVLATVVVVRGPEWARAYVLTIVATFVLVAACIFGIAVFTT